MGKKARLACQREGRGAQEGYSKCMSHTLLGSVKTSRGFNCSKFNLWVFFRTDGAFRFKVKDPLQAMKQSNIA